MSSRFHVSGYAFLLVISLILVLGILMISVPSRGATLTVDDDDGGAADFSTIQDAVNASENGDTIRVFDGVYREHVYINTSVNIMGNGSGSCTIDAGGNGIALLVVNADVNVSGFTITGGGCCNGAGFRVKSSTAVIKDISCVDNGNAGIHLLESTVDIADTYFSGNIYGILGYRSQNCVISDSLFENNTWGIYLRECETSLIMNITTRDNLLDGIFFQDSNSNSIVGCTIIGNENGIEFKRSHHNLVTEVICSNNTGFFGNGLSFSESSNNTISFSEIRDNGCGIHLQLNCRGTTVRNCTVSGNSAYGIDTSENNGEEVNAVVNWWGHTSGPYNRLRHPGGSGDNVTDEVDFYPWNGTLFMEPWVEIDEPMNGSVVNGTVVISGTAGDPDGYVEFVELSLDQVSWGTVNGTDSWSYFWNTSGLENGSYSIPVRAFDGTYHSSVLTLNLTVEHISDDVGNNGGNNGNGTNGGGSGGGTGDDDDLLPGTVMEGVIAAFVLSAAVVFVKKRRGDP